jgi:hypothetical protein
MSPEVKPGSLDAVRDLIELLGTVGDLKIRPAGVVFEIVGPHGNLRLRENEHGFHASTHDGEESLVEPENPAFVTRCAVALFDLDDRALNGLRSIL